MGCFFPGAMGGFSAALQEMFRFNSEVEVYLDLADSDADDPDEEDLLFLREKSGGTRKGLFKNSPVGAF